MKIEQTQDVEVIRPLAHRWFADAAMNEHGLRPDLERLMAELRASLKNLTGTLLVARDETEIVGLLAVFAVPQPLHDRPWALVHYWYSIEPQAWVGTRLFQAAYQWGKRAGCSHLMLAASTLMPDSERTISAFAERAGLKKYETLFLGELV